ncbi:MAG TPA: twin-arginine translocase TatA/TatE family subunit [Sphingomicrobium sp.]|nr:twin-arginine translocase TatA/TatE family subunit [Sphingomicrobium sp.]
MGGFSIWHILIFAIILLLLFGGNRFSSMMGDVAKGLKSFKHGMSDDEDDARKRYEKDRRSEPPRSIGRQDPPIDVTPRPADPTAAPPPRDDEAR